LLSVDPENMENIFAAVEIIQSFVPRKVQFTGTHLDDGQRKNCRNRGESGACPSAPLGARGSRNPTIQRGAGQQADGFYIAPTGGRFLTCAEFMVSGSSARD